MKIYLFIISFCVGIWGLSSSIFPEYSREILMGMLMPLAVTLISLQRLKFISRTRPDDLSKFLIKAFVLKMLLYGGFIVILFTFYAFHQIAFIISFAGYFIALFATEAILLKSTLEKLT
ncbi:MAG: hypothetical protein V3S22_00265 [Candidatus Neomarinimicrobiota bacterium]